MAKAAAFPVRSRDPVDPKDDFGVQHLVWTFDLPAPDELSDTNPVDIEGSFIIQRTPGGKTQKNFELDISHEAEGFQHIEKMELNGKELKQGKDYRIYNDPTGRRYMLIEKAIKAGDTIDFGVKLRADLNTTGEGLYISTNKATGKKVYLTQNEQEGFRNIIPFFDRPSVAIRDIQTSIVAPASLPVLLSNGALIRSTALNEEYRRKAWHISQPMPSYLFALVAGELDMIGEDFTRRDGVTIRAEAYADPGQGPNARVALSALLRAMRFDENPKGYNFVFPHDQMKMVGFSAFNMGAMENNTLITFNDQRYLAHPTLSTDAAIREVALVTGHEYFHTLTGNDITICDFSEPALKEGLTTYRESQYMADLFGTGEYVRRIQTLRANQFLDDNGPLAHPIYPGPGWEPNVLYDDTTYRKGAFLYGVLHTMIGDKAFYEGMRLYREKWSGKAAKFDDFLAAMSEASGKDLSQYKLWWTQSGTPEVTANWSYNAKKDELTLTLRQKNANGKPVPIPLPVSFAGKNGQPLSRKGETVVLEKDAQTFTFSGFGGKAPLVAFGSHKVPVRFEAQGSSNTDLARIMISKTLDPMMRYEAAQQLQKRIILDMYKNKSPTIGGRDAYLLMDVYRGLLKESGTKLDPEMKAYMLQPPSVEELSLAVGKNVNYAKLTEARAALRRELGKSLAPELREAFKRNKTPAFDPAEDLKAWGKLAQKRSLRVTALGLLNAAGMAGDLVGKIANDPESNITERRAALAMLAAKGTLEGDIAVEKAGLEWRGANFQPAVGDWKKLNAAAPRADDFARAHAMSAEALADPKWVANDVYNTVNAYLGENIASFHAHAAQSYKWAGDVVCKIAATGKDVVASKTLRYVVRDMHRLPDRNRKLMQDALQEILKAPRAGLATAFMAKRALALPQKPKAKGAAPH